MRRAGAAVLVGAALAGVLVGVLAAGCARDEKLVRYKPFLAGIDGVQTATPAVGVERPAAIGVAGAGTGAGVGAGIGAGAEVEAEVRNPDGTVTLRSPSGLFLMRHIERCLAEENAELFATQVLSERTRGEFVERGVDPKLALGMLAADRREISRLFGQMPMGEYSSNVAFEPLGDNVFRVRLVGSMVWKVLSAGGTREVRWVGFDMVLEKDGNWRLRWMVPVGG